jgi:cysteinyl-tRNA synthetase
VKPLLAIAPLAALLLSSCTVGELYGPGGVDAPADLGPRPDLWVAPDRGVPPEGGFVHDVKPLAPDLPPVTPNPLSKVKYWGYQIQGLTESGAVSKLVSSKYDMLVLEPTRTDKGTSGFDAKGMVNQLHATNGKSGFPRIVIAYIDIGEAENWRYYWKSWWSKPSKNSSGDPDFLVTTDPDGWAGNYPVAYWDKRWKDIIIYNTDSMLQKAIDDGFDGIYMDWVEGYSNKQIKAAASDAGKDPAVEMIKFITEIRAHARKQNPKFLVIAQNAPGLVDGHPEYLKQIDALAQEQIYFDGDADTDWSDWDSCDQVVPDTGHGYSRDYYVNKLKIYQNAGLPVFNCEYACDSGNVAEAYTESAKHGFATYVTRRPLSRLTTTPPPGY